MKHIKKFNESKVGDFVRKTFNKDEETAIGIYDKITDDISIQDVHKNGQQDYSFSIDGFDIVTCYEYSTMDDYSEFSLIVDGITLKCSSKIAEKIHKRISFLFRRQLSKDDEEFLSKDAKINFRKK